MSQAAPWWPEEIEAWRLPEVVTVSAWADRERILSAEAGAAQPGPWSTGLVPYLREIQDCLNDLETEQVTFVKPTQVGGTEAAVNCLGYVTAEDPAPCMVVAPDGDLAKKWATKRWTPTVKASPALAREMTGNPDHLKTTETQLKRNTVYFASAGSPAALAFTPVRVLILDEVDKYPRRSGREASPLKLARERTRTFWNRKIYVLSTPTEEEGIVWQEYQKGSRERLWCPCPHCGGWQVLEFEFIQWPETERDPERIRGQDLAEYFCPRCGEAIPNHDKLPMVRRGRWVSDKYERIDPGTGAVRGTRPRPLRHRSFWLNCLYSPFLTWSEIAAEFLDSLQDPATHRNFVNSWQARPWVEDRRENPEAAAVLALRCELAPREAPREAVAIVAGVDTQRSHFWFTLWAFGPDLASWLLDYGKLSTLEEVEGLGAARYHRDGAPELGLWRGGIDTGGTKTEEEGWSRTEEVYAWLRAHRGPFCGVKGYAAQTRLALQERVRESTAAATEWRDIPLFLVNRQNMTTLFFERLLNGAAMGQPVALHRDTGADFVGHVLGVERRRSRTTGRYSWEKARGRVDLLDCSLYAHATVEPAWRGGLARLAAALRAGPRKPAAPAVRAAKGHPLNVQRVRFW